jgi:hypothetical protein
MKKLYSHILFVSLALLSLYACREDEGTVKPNQFPETKFSIDDINLSGDNRLNSLVSLSWSGSDPDGYVVGYEISFDQVNWSFTTEQDSTFKFSIDGGADTTDISIYIRSIDNIGAKDPSPDQLTIPLKNTQPTIEFDADLSIPDSVFLVSTTAWSAFDLDGLETITNVYISLNGAAWYEINKNKKTFSIAPSDANAADTTSARIYYESDLNPNSKLIDGLILNDTNRIFIKAVDQAGSESEVDTSNTFYLKGKKNDVLLVSGNDGNAKTIYQRTLTNVGVPFDNLDLLANNGLFQPKIWNITFRLQLSFYNKLFFYSNESSYINSYTGASGLLLEFAAASLQQFANQGGKYLITTNFDHNQNIDGFIGVLPISSVSAKNYGSARLYANDSIVIADANLVGFPNLSTQNTLIGVGVYNIDTLDTEALYYANVVDGRPNRPWTDTKVIASGRRVGGKLNQVYFGMQLWELYKSPAKLEVLFNQIFNVEFN